MKGTLTYNDRRDRPEVVFPGKPDAATRATLKAAGFWWDRAAGVWYLSRPPVIDGSGNLIGDPRKAAIDAVLSVADCDRDEYNRAEDFAGHRAGERGMEMALGIA